MPAPIRITGARPLAGRKSGLGLMKASIRSPRPQSVQMARAQPARMLAHANLQPPVTRTRGQRVIARQVTARRQDAHQIARGKAREGPTRQPRQQAAARQGEAEDAGRRLHRLAIVAAREQRQRVAARAGGHMGQRQRFAQNLGQLGTPARERLRGLTVDGGKRHQRRPALPRQRRLDIPREPAEFRELPVAEAKDRDGAGGCCPHRLKPRHEAFGRSGRRPIAIGRGEDQHPVGARIGRCQAVHRAGMHLVAVRGQRIVQGARETPGAAALAADKDDGIGRLRGYIRLDPGPRAAARCPDQHTGYGHHGHGQRRHPEDQAEPPKALPGVQHVNRFIDPPRRAMVPPDQHPPGSLIDITIARGGLDAVGIRRVIRIGEGQLAQVAQVDVPESVDPVHRHGRAAIHLRRQARGLGCAAGDHVERRQRHVHPGQRRQHQSRHRHPPEIDMQALAARAARAAQDLRPSPHAPRGHLQARHRQHQHRQRPQPGGNPSGIVQKKRPVQVGHPAFNAGGRIVRNRLTARRVHDHRGGEAIFEIQNNDLARRRAPYLLDARIAVREPSGQIGHADRARRCGDGAAALQRGKDRQNRPAQRQNADQKCRQKAGKLVKLTQHDAPPFGNRDHRP